MLKSTSLEGRQAQKAPSFAVIWAKEMENPEVVFTDTGKPNTGISAVCKQNIAVKFFRLHAKLSTIDDDEINMRSYGDAKESVKTYVVSGLLGKFLQEMRSFCG